VQGRPYQPSKVLDEPSSTLSQYSYEDFRKFSLGVRGVDERGAKVSHPVTAEDHSLDF
jgi:hypothetical protein